MTTKPMLYISTGNEHATKSQYSDGLCSTPLHFSPEERNSLTQKGKRQQSTFPCLVGPGIPQCLKRFIQARGMELKINWSLGDYSQAVWECLHPKYLIKCAWPEPVTFSYSIAIVGMFFTRDGEEVEVYPE